MSSLISINSGAAGASSFSEAAGAVVALSAPPGYSTYAWSLLSYPEPVAPAFSTPASYMTDITLTLGYDGHMWIVKLVVDAGLPTEDADVVAIGAPHPTLGWIVPAAGLTYLLTGVPGGWANKEWGLHKILTDLMNSGGAIQIVSPTAPGASVGLSGNNVAGAMIAQWFLSPPAGEPADPAVSGAYYLHFDNGVDSEDVVVWHRYGNQRYLTTPLQHTYNAGSATVAYAGPATSPATSGGMPSTALVRVDALPAFSDTNPQPLGPAAPGTDYAWAHADHVHAHGNQAGGTLHDEATTSAAGFMSAADKDLLYERKQRILLFQEEFVDNITNRWGTTVTGTGAAVALSSAAGASPGGRCQLSTGSTATGVAQLRTSINFAYSNRSDEVVFDTVVGLTALANGTDDFRAYASGLFGHGIFTQGYAFVYDPALSANWLLARFSGGVIAASADTGVAVTGGGAPSYGGEKRLTTVYEKSLDRVLGYIDGVLVATLTGIGNIGAVYFIPAVIEKTLGTTSISMVVDYTRCIVTPSAGTRA